MPIRTFAASCAVALSLCLLAGCGGSSLPRTQANLSVCGVLAHVLDGKASLIQLGGATIETNAPISHKLRQDIATYWSLASQHAPSGDAAVKAEGDCSSIKAPLAKAFGGS